MGRPDTCDLSFGAVYGLSCLSACIAETVTFPLDLFKTRIQAERMRKQDHASYRSYQTRVLSIFRQAIAHEHGGYMNLWRGLTPACLRHLVYSGSRLGLYEYIREDVFGRDPIDGSFPLHKAVAAGMLSGAIGQFLSSPADMVKVRMQTELGQQRAVAAATAGAAGAAGGGLSPSPSPSPSSSLPSSLSPRRSTYQAFQAIFKEGGIRGLWRGWVPNCQRAALVQLGDLTTYDCVKQRLLRKEGEGEEGWGGGGWGWEDNARTHACASLAAGLVAAFLGTPADVVKTRCMNQKCDPVTGEGLVYRGSFHCLSTVVREEGVLALWRGCFLNWLRMAPWSLTFYLSFEHLRKVAGLSSF